MKKAKPKPHAAPSLRAAGEVLWGPQYRSEMARALDVHLRTAMRWDRGETPVPEEVWVSLVAMLRERKKAIDGVIVKVKEEIA